MQEQNDYKKCKHYVRGICVLDKVICNLRYGITQECIDWEAENER